MPTEISTYATNLILLLYIPYMVVYTITGYFVYGRCCLMTWDSDTDLLRTLQIFRPIYRFSYSTHGHFMLKHLNDGSIQSLFD